MKRYVLTRSLATAVVAAGGVVLAVLELRLHEIWGAGNG